MYSSSQGYNLVNNPDKNNTHVTSAPQGDSRQLYNENPMSYPPEQMVPQYPSQTSEQFGPGGSNFSPQDFSYQSNMMPPMPNQGYYSNDPTNQNPYYGGYMYNPNAWAYQQQQQMQMQQLFHYYQSFFQQQNPSFEQEGEQLQKKMDQLSLNTPVQEPTPSTSTKEAKTTPLKELKEPKKTKQPEPQNRQSDSSTQPKEKSTSPKTWAQTVSKNKDTHKNTSIVSKDSRKSGERNRPHNVANKTQNKFVPKYNKDSAQTKHHETQKSEQLEKPHTAKPHHYHNNRKNFNQNRKHYNNRHFKSNIIKLTSEDYNFEESNTIDRDRIDLEEDVSIGYNKDAFFDNLNEDEPEERDNKSFRESKKLDRETFGTTRRPYRKRNPRYNQNYRNNNNKAKSSS